MVGGGGKKVESRGRGSAFCRMQVPASKYIPMVAGDCNAPNALFATFVCICSTPAIARHARAAGKTAIVHPNLLSPGYVALGTIISPVRPALRRDPLIGYMSGSNTHDGDLASVGLHLAPSQGWRWWAKVSLWIGLAVAACLVVGLGLWLLSTIRR